MVFLLLLFFLFNSPLFGDNCWLGSCPSFHSALITVFSLLKSDVLLSRICPAPQLVPPHWAYNHKPHVIRCGKVIKLSLPLLIYIVTCLCPRLKSVLLFSLFSSSLKSSLIWLYNPADYPQKHQTDVVFDIFSRSGPRCKTTWSDCRC